MQGSQHRQPRTPLAFAMPAYSSKVVHLIRHGQGHHNVAARDNGKAAYRSEALLDAKLDRTGRHQARELGKMIRERDMKVDLILVSPMTRALQTASLAFEDSARYLAVEEVREAFGAHPCDKRRPISQVSREFPHVDFSLVRTDTDTWHNDERRETVAEVASRCTRFLQFLQSRREKNIAVVSHGVFLETLLQYCLGVMDTRLTAHRFRNCEIRSVMIGAWTHHPTPIPADVPLPDGYWVRGDANARKLENAPTAVAASACLPPRRSSTHNASGSKKDKDLPASRNYSDPVAPDESRSSSKSTSSISGNYSSMDKGKDKTGANIVKESPELHLNTQSVPSETVKRPEVDAVEYTPQPLQAVDGAATGSRGALSAEDPRYTN